MNLSLKPHPLVAHWVPGFVALAIILAAAFNWDYSCLIRALAPKPESAAVSIFILAVIAFVIGEFLDAIRNGFIEDRLDRCHRINWDFFFDGGSREIKNLNEHFFTWYVADLNLGLAIVLGGALASVHTSGRYLISRWTFALLFVVAFFWWDAWTLRKEIKHNIDRCYRPWNYRKPYTR